VKNGKRVWGEKEIEWTSNFHKLSPELELKNPNDINEIERVIKETKKITNRLAREITYKKLKKKRNEEDNRRNRGRRMEGL
jgi:hypothetical protein